MLKRNYRKHLVFGRFNGLRVARLFDRSESKKGDKDQESIQSSTTPDSGYHMGKRQKHKTFTKISGISRPLSLTPKSEVSSSLKQFQGPFSFELCMCSN